MRSHLRYLLLDGFDPETGELALRVSAHGGDAVGPQLLRLKLHLGRHGDALQPLRRELTNLVQMPLPQLWDRGLKLFIRAIEDELNQPEGRDARRYMWVQTQILHPTDERRSTLNHPVQRQVEILWDWAQRLDQEGDGARAMELVERLLLLSPKHRSALEWLSTLLRNQGMVEEMLDVTERWLAVEPNNPAALLRRGEALVYLEQPRDAMDAFQAILKSNPLHAVEHLGAAQAASLQGGDPFPHLDAAMELDKAVTLSVLQETFDYRVITRRGEERGYALADLPTLLGVSSAEVRTYVQECHLPLSGEAVREIELTHWVGIQNRYQLLPNGLHWTAPTPRSLPG
jgi:tetratricopeptide (TPR) repeat protein